MHKETKQENSSPLPIIKHKIVDPPRKPLGEGVSSCIRNNERLKRDEWSEGAITSLLEAYETKWVLRNRAKLKGRDWEDVAKYVSSRINSTKSPKTQTQCKNKIESMKKRYRSESAAAGDTSSWPLFQRLDLLLRGTSAPPQPVSLTLPSPPPLMITEQPPPQPVASQQLPLVATTVPPPPPAEPVHVTVALNSHGSNGADRAAKEDGMASKLSDNEADKNAMETDSSTPALYNDKEKMIKSTNQKTRTTTEKRKRRRREDWEMGDSIRWLAEVVMRSEQARVDTMRDLEKMRAEAEAKRNEMELKRTEIIANTQLEIAKLFAGFGKGVDSSLRIGRS